jgi:hypothetical protein
MDAKSVVADAPMSKRLEVRPDKLSLTCVRAVLVIAATQRLEYTLRQGLSLLCCKATAATTDDV